MSTNVCFVYICYEWEKTISIVFQIYSGGLFCCWGSGGGGGDIQEQPLTHWKSLYQTHCVTLDNYLYNMFSLVKQELLTIPKHLRSPLVFSSVRVTRSLVLYVCFVDRCLSFCTFSFGHCVVCSSIYGFWLPLWYLQFKLFFLILVNILPYKRPYKPI